MEEKIYQTPCITVLMAEEDVICTSADTDISFETPDTDVPFSW